MMDHQSGKRFGGSHSPGGAANPLENRAPQKRRGRLNLLYLAAAPLVLTSFFSDTAAGTAIHIIALAVMMGACWLTGEGLEAEDAYNSRSIAKRPAIPRKMIGAGLMGLGVALATLDGQLISGFIYGLLAAGLHLASFGLDPMRDKAVTGGDDFQTDRVARAVDEAEAHLGEMLRTIEALGDRIMTTRVEQFQTTARKMFRSIEEDPRSLTAARRYLGVYLLGARDATRKFVDLYTRNRDQAAKADYNALLDDLEQNFAAKTGTLLEGKSADLEIEISVLRDRLDREGVKLNEGE